MDFIAYVNSDELYHHGIKGQRWGIRRWQNDDGSLTEAGRRHYDVQERKIAARAERATARAQVKAAKVQSKMYSKAQKAQAKEDQKNLKKQAKIEKYEAEKMKLELKQMKQEIAYQKGSKFADAFLPAVGRALGEGFGRAAGEGMANMANIQKWKELKTERIKAQAEKINASANKMDKKLARDKYDDGYSDREQEIKDRDSKTNERNSITDRMKAEDARQQQQYNLSERGQKVADEKRATEKLKAETESTKAGTDRIRAENEASEKGREIALENARAEREKQISAGKKAEADILGAKVGMKKAETEKIDAEIRRDNREKDLEIKDRESKAKIEYDKNEQEARRAKANLDEIFKRQEMDDNRAAARAKDALDIAKERNRAELERMKLENARADADNKARLAWDRENAIQTRENNKVYNAHEIEKMRIEERREHRQAILAEIPQARQILLSDNASPSARQAANNILRSAYNFNSYSAKVSDPLKIQVTSLMPSQYAQNGITY